MLGLANFHRPSHVPCSNKGNSQRGALEEVCEEEDGGRAHADAGELAHGAVHGAVGQCPAGLPLGLAKHLHPAKSLISSFYRGTPAQRSV